MKRGPGLLFLTLLSLFACKKDPVDEAEQPVSPLTGTRTEFTLDSIYLYAKQVYLWNDILPSYQTFNPRKYNTGLTEITAFRTELYDISQLKNNPLTGSPYELPLIAGNPRYSYLETGTGSGTLAAVGNSGQPAVLQTSMLNAGSVPVGYIALGSFPALSAAKTALDNAFANLSLSSPQVLIIDLRSNGGGYVETAEYVANLVAPTALNGKTMYIEQYNPLLQTGKATILKNQPYLDSEGKTVTYNGRNATLADVDYSVSGNTYRFSKKGNLNSITDLYFIVSGSTASASELLISSLKPYFNVKLVGQKTYGKPVGFFPVRIDTYSVYLSSFLISNAQGWSDYFSGMPVDTAVNLATNAVPGDPDEAAVHAALALIVPAPVTTGNTATVQTASLNSKATVSSLNTAGNTVTPTLAISPAAGMIETRFRLRK